MFSPQQKREIAMKVQTILKATAHDELSTGEVAFILHVDGTEDWSWTNIRNRSDRDIPVPDVLAQNMRASNQRTEITVRRPSMNKLNFSYDEYRDILTIESLNYSGSFFRALADGGLALFEPFEIIGRTDGVATIRRLMPVVADVVPTAHADTDDHQA